MGKDFKNMFSSNSETTSGFDDVPVIEEQPKKETPKKTETKKAEPAAHKVIAKKSGRRRDEPAEGEMRKTYLVDKNLADKIEGISYWERINIKDVVNDAFRTAIKKYENRHGEIKLKPKDKVKSVFK
ncbi:hypothetical protein [Piscirickettsia litoralis]|uniref:Uncharacterized protein n=1 Tax=Piscirickettsia litoralis TaxID=1891921 RepID=A0ABX2ZWP0_9GAMM|nr:hypothetical protein [Piscirickettsia litoralis]ODN41037.1 hypothetical protein BGC07_18575 [Piscirickettsia litoralis]